MKIRSLMLMALLLSGCASMPSSPQQEAEGNMTGNDPITAEDNATQEERVDDVDEAIAIACTDAGVSQRELFDTKQQREEESGIAVHKIEFETAYGDYDYAIAVEDGRIIDADYEVDEEWLDRLGGTPLDMNEAASRVAAKIGADTEDIRIWQEEDDGRIRYEGEAFHDGVKDEFEMDAETGIISDWDLGITAENEDR